MFTSPKSELDTLLDSVEERLKAEVAAPKPVAAMPQQKVQQPQPIVTPQSDEVLRMENQDLKAQIVELQKKIDEVKRASMIVSDDPRRVKLVMDLLSSELFARHLFAGNGELVDLDAVSRRLDELQAQACTPASVLPAAPPTAIQPGPPAASPDTNGSKPGRLSKVKSFLSGAPVNQ